MPALNLDSSGSAACRRREFRSRLWFAFAASAVSVVTVVAGWVMPAWGASVTEVNTCGQVFSGNGFLSGDLDCGGYSGDAVTIQGGALDLRGFRLTAAAPFSAVRCTGSCKAISDPSGGTIASDGSGTISAVFGNSGFGSRVNIQVSDVLANDAVLFTQYGTIKMIDSTITGIADPASRAVSTFSGTVRLLRSVVTGNAGRGVSSAMVKIVDSEVSNNGGDGVWAGFHTARIIGSTIIGNGLAGVSGMRIKVVDSTLTGNGTAGIVAGFNPPSERVAGRVKIIRSDISSNLGQGVIASVRSVSVGDSTIENNGAEGIRQELSPSFQGAITRVTDSTVAGNGLDGIAQPINAPARCRLKAKGSTFTGNGADASCGVSRTCADLSSCNPPDVSSTICETSYDVNSDFPGVSWGVCSLD